MKCINFMSKRITVAVVILIIIARSDTFLGIERDATWWQFDKRRDIGPYTKILYKGDDHFQSEYAPKFKNTAKMFSTDTKPAGASIRLRCVSEGNPTPNITWYKGSKAGLPISRPTDLLTIFNGWGLYMEGLTKADAGKYTCVVCNVYGCIQHTVTLRVLDPYPTKPFIADGYPKNTTVPLHGSAMLLCPTFSGLVVHSYWMRPSKFVFKDPDVLFGSEPIPPGRLVKSQNFDDKPEQLTIHNVTKADEGWYVCIAMNTLGRSIGKAYLTVKDETRTYNEISPTVAMDDLSVVTMSTSRTDETLSPDFQAERREISPQPTTFRIDLRPIFTKPVQTTKCACCKDNIFQFRRIFRNELRYFFKHPLKDMITHLLQEKLAPLIHVYN